MKLSTNESTVMTRALCRLDGPGLEVGGQRVLEVGGLEVLTISEEDWSSLQHRLAFPLPVVSVRRVEEDTGEMCPDCGLPVLHLVWRLREVLTVLCLSTLRRDVPGLCPWPGGLLS